MGELIKNGKGLIGVPWNNGLNCYSFAAKCANPAGAGAISFVPYTGSTDCRGNHHQGTAVQSMCGGWFRRRFGWRAEQRA